MLERDVRGALARLEIRHGSDHHNLVSLTTMLERLPPRVFSHAALVVEGTVWRRFNEKRRLKAVFEDRHAIPLIVGEPPRRASGA